MFGKLPSEVLAAGTTFDMMVMNMMITWENQQHEKAAGKKSTPTLTQKEMMDMLAKVRDTDGKRN